MKSTIRIMCGVLALGVGSGQFLAQQAATGVVRAEEAVIVRSEVVGIVDQIDVQEGQRISEGEPLVHLRKDLQEIGLRLAAARLDRAEATAAASEVTLENARHTLARVEVAATALTEKEYEDVIDEVHRLEALLKAQEAEVVEFRVEQDLRQQEFDARSIRAPFDGTVTAVYLVRGDAVAPLETPILALVLLDQLYVELALPVSELPRLAEGMRVGIDVESEVLGPAGQVGGVIRYINPTVDPSSRTFLVKVGFSDPPGQIRPGMRADVELP